ncbi:hypothetical protein KAR91_59345 [Candidatus Pacearchaeota archaeon]|nr:hypothetical protein [Candidatus Pacearchaeota archaeon]
MITDGINNWFRGMGDAAMNAGFEITNVTGAPVEGGSTVNVIFKIASWTYDPYSNPGIVDIIKFTMTIWGVLMLMYILAGMVWVNIQDSKPNAAQSLAFITGMNTNTAFSHYVNNLKDSLMIAVFSHAVIYLILTLNLVFSRMILSTMLDVIAPSPDNILLYLMMGYTYLVMSFFFLVRFFVINIFVAFAPILGILYVTNYFTRSIATKAFNCFCTMVFMQTVIVFFTSIGILAIKGLGPMYARDPSSYIVLMILLVVVAIIMMVGWVFVKRSAKTVVNVVAL